MDLQWTSAASFASQNRRFGSHAVPCLFIRASSFVCRFNMSSSVDCCVHWQADWGAGQTHCRLCRKLAKCHVPPIKSKSGSVAVAGVLSFLQNIRRHLSPVADCSGGNAAAGNIFLAAMHSNPTAWGDTYERADHCDSLVRLLSHEQAAGSAPTAGRRSFECSIEHLRAPRRRRVGPPSWCMRG
jgi:hypothetical protein